MTKVKFEKGMDNEQVTTVALENLMMASMSVMALWNAYGLGDDEAESEPIYNIFKSAVLDARSVLTK